MWLWWSWLKGLWWSCAWEECEFGAVGDSGMEERPEGGGGGAEAGAEAGAEVEVERPAAATRLWSCAADKC